MKSPNCVFSILVHWVKHDGSSMLGQACWVKHVGSSMLGQACWVKHVGSSMLGQA